MKFLLCVFLALFIVASGMPMRDGNAEDLIHSAEQGLSVMANDEQNELNEMGEIQNAIKHLPDHVKGNEDFETEQVEHAAQLIWTNEKKAIGQETDQQSAATAALSQVNTAITTLQDQEQQHPFGKKDTKRLGEQQATSAVGVEQALNKLQQVSATLTQGTQTSNTMHRIERMKVETNDLVQETTNSKPTNEQMKQEESAFAATGEAPTQLGSRTVSTSKETNELKRILEQEKKVEQSEKSDLAEVAALTHKLG